MLSVLFVALLLICSTETLKRMMHEKEAVCNAEGCYAVFFHKKSFLDSWRSCRENGGNLATIKRPEEAALIQELFSGLDLTEDRGQQKFWIGLQRQPRQCTALRPLRGFTWMTGDQDTQYTNWLKPPSTTCPAPRCVVMTYGQAKEVQAENYKWLDGSCSIPVDGYLCKFSYKGMCSKIEISNSFGGVVMYTTPFNLVSSLLVYVPFGSVAVVPCGGMKPDLSVLCAQKENGQIGWSRDEPFCEEDPRGFCLKDNGGCDHMCIEAGDYYYCDCDDGYILEDDRQSCSPIDHCERNPCQHTCIGNGDSYMCTCPEGYILAENGHDCEDIDECSQAISCEQICINTVGSYECQCTHGFHLEGNHCKDTDECKTEPCDHACENTEGSYTCYCRLGFILVEEGSHTCVDIDECQIPDTCEHMCVNYIGGFECYCNEGFEFDTASCKPIMATDKKETVTFSISSTAPMTNSGPEHIETTQEDKLVTKYKESYIEYADVPPEIPQTTMQQEITGKILHKSLWQAEQTSTSSYTEKELNAHLITDSIDVTATTDSTSTEKDLLTPETGATSQQMYFGPANVNLVHTVEGTSLKESITKTSSSHSIHFTNRVKVSPSWTVLNSVPELSNSSSVHFDGHAKANQNNDDRWFIVALLVPLCTFVVIMLALGIVYCTRCGSKSKAKSITDCYRWITNTSNKTSTSTGKGSDKSNA